MKQERGSYRLPKRTCREDMEKVIDFVKRGFKNKEIAQKINRSNSMTKKLAYVARNLIPEGIKAYTDGEITFSDAIKYAAKPEEEQRKIILKIVKKYSKKKTTKRCYKKYGKLVREREELEAELQKKRKELEELNKELNRKRSSIAFMSLARSIFTRLEKEEIILLERAQSCTIQHDQRWEVMRWLKLLKRMEELLNNMLKTHDVNWTVAEEKKYQ